MEDEYYVISMRNTVQLAIWLWEHPHAVHLRVNTLLGFWGDYVVDAMKHDGVFDKKRHCFLTALQCHPSLQHLEFGGSSYMSHLQVYSLCQAVASRTSSIQTVSVQAIPLENVHEAERMGTIGMMLPLIEQATPRLRKFEVVTSGGVGSEGDGICGDETGRLNEIIQRVLRMGSSSSKL